MGSTELLVSTALLVRLLAPLLMFRHAALGMITALAADIVDGLLLEGVPGFDTEHKHPYDKPLDTYYLAIAYLVVLRNWTDARSIRIARLFWCWRLAGVAAYLVTDDRTVFFLCPAAFEFFFLGIEALRGRETTRNSAAAGVAAVAAAALALKLPQEYWLHVKEGSSTAFVTQNLFGADPTTTRLQLAADHAPWVAAVILLGVITGRKVRRTRNRAGHRRRNDDLGSRRAQAGGLTHEEVATSAVAGFCIVLALGALPRSDGQPHLLAVCLFLTMAAAIALAVRDRSGGSV